MTDREIAETRIAEANNALDMLQVALATTGDRAERKRILGQIADQKRRVAQLHLHLAPEYRRFRPHRRRVSFAGARRSRAVR